MFLHQLRQQVKHIRADEIHLVGEPVLLRVRAGKLHRSRGNIHGGDVRGSRFCGVERERAGMREAVQHALAARDFRRREAVVFLVEEEASLLPVLNVHIVSDAVFDDLDARARRLRQKRGAIPTLLELQAFQLTDADLVALKDAADFDAVVAQERYQQAVEHVLDALDTDGEHLAH